MNEWTNEWMNGGREGEWMNERMNEWREGGGGGWRKRMSVWQMSNGRADGRNNEQDKCSEKKTVSWIEDR
jgi:hypothetical protein